MKLHIIYQVNNALTNTFKTVTVHEGTSSFTREAIVVSSSTYTVVKDVAYAKLYVVSNNEKILIN